jgi:hypothetical protein
MQMPGLILFVAKPTDFHTGRRACFQKNGRLYNYLSFRQFCRRPLVPGEGQLARYFGYHFPKIYPRSRSPLGYRFHYFGRKIPV